MTRNLLKIFFILTLIGITIIAPVLRADKKNNTILYKEQVAVIMYHHVDDMARSSGTVTTKLFRDQLAYLKEKKGYQFITLKQFKEYLQAHPFPTTRFWLPLMTDMPAFTTMLTLSSKACEYPQ